MNIKVIILLIALSGMMLVGKTTIAQKTIGNDTIVMTGKIVKEQFVHNKPVKGVYDYFFQTGDKKYFVKTYKSKYSKVDLDKWVGQLVKVMGVVINYGSWDDNGEGQSRVGEYLLLVEVKKMQL